MWILTWLKDWHLSSCHMYNLSNFASYVSFWSTLENLTWHFLQSETCNDGPSVRINIFYSLRKKKNVILSFSHRFAMKKPFGGEDWRTLSLPHGGLLWLCPFHNSIPKIYIGASKNNPSHIFFYHKKFTLPKFDDTTFFPCWMTLNIGWWHGKC